MPIYEFYCHRCNTIFRFYSRRVNTEKIPCCPECRDVRLERRMSVFATISGRQGEDEQGNDMPPIDESRMEKAMEMLAKEAENINEDDPRQAATLMRRLSEAAGLKMGDGMEEALSKLEKGEDPDRIEEELGELIEEEEPFVFESRGKKTKGKKGPRIDETLYEL